MAAAFASLGELGHSLEQRHLLQKPAEYILWHRKIRIVRHRIANPVRPQADESNALRPESAASVRESPSDHD